jgi:hypothetical protein
LSDIDNEWAVEIPSNKEKQRAYGWDGGDLHPEDDFFITVDGEQSDPSNFSDLRLEQSTERYLPFSSHSNSA